ncbi:MAG TPA: DEAD/DEAH box helicase, partial [Pirellulaceae bacterium]
MTNPHELPVFAALPAILAAVRAGGVILSAPPGSGKTTLVPPAILDELGPRGGAVLLIQPRRLAARAVARHIARLRGTQLGDEIGYQVRFDHCVSRGTRLIAQTTGILLRRLMDDCALEGVAAVVLDEFHERSVEIDLAFGMLRRIQETLRPDLRLVIMSATLETQALAQAWPHSQVL